jgi:2-polyprenyl-3-methyl-5-hydroxy-6-metoxy-1,4-benzoquinol methylase
MSKATIAADAEGRWKIEGCDPDQARAFLTRHQPWRMEIDFGGALNSKNYPKFEPFNGFPLRKLNTILAAIATRGGLPTAPRALDIGFNNGYNALYLAQTLGAQVTGIDVAPKHLAVATDLAQMTGLQAEFLLQSAEEFLRPASYDLVLHLGTLYHLPNPVLSMERAIRSLQPGGWLALETIRYLADPLAARWIHGFNGDKSNYWALGETILTELFTLHGMAPPELLFSAKVPVLAQIQSDRAIYIARKL